MALFDMDHSSSTRRILQMLIVLTGCLVFFDIGLASRKPPPQPFDPNTVSVQRLYDMSCSTYEAGHYGTAEDYLENILRRMRFKRVYDKQFMADVYYKLSQTYMMRGHQAYFKYKDNSYYEKAIENAEKCLHNKADYWEAYEVIAEVFFNQRALEQALANYRKALEFIPEYDPEYGRVLEQIEKIERFVEKKKENDKKKTKDYETLRLE